MASTASDKTTKAALDVIRTAANAKVPGDVEVYVLNKSEAPKVEAYLQRIGSTRRVNPAGFVQFGIGNSMGGDNSGADRGGGSSSGGGSSNSGNHDGGSGGGNRTLNQMLTPNKTSTPSSSAPNPGAQSPADAARQLVNNVLNQVNSVAAPETPTNVLQQAQESNGRRAGFVDNADLGGIGAPGTIVGNMGSSNPGNLGVGRTKRRRFSNTLFE